MTIVTAGAFTALRRFTLGRANAERCDLCAQELAADHDHLFQPDIRRLRCVCQACRRLLGDTPRHPWKLVRHRVQRLADFRLSDDDWRALGLPIDLAFFTWSSMAAAAVALYPSPAGLVESPLDVPVWHRLVGAHPEVRQLQPDVEGVLARRTGLLRDHYVVSVDEGYRLIGVLRRHWQGFGGGAEVEARIREFFVDLDRQGGAA